MLIGPNSKLFGSKLHATSIQAASRDGGRFGLFVGQQRTRVISRGNFCDADPSVRNSVEADGIWRSV